MKPDAIPRLKCRCNVNSLNRHTTLLTKTFKNKKNGEETGNRAPTPTAFSCYIIGETSLVIQCAEMLLNRGQKIYGVISSDASIRRWTQQTDIPHRQSTGDASEFLRERPFDYLFSIVNGHILPTAILELPRKGTINYHDSLLPRYAGTHATSWALMNRETIHGVTWHAVTDVVDAGDILKQVSFRVVEDETALTLNTKCYEAAIRSFGELVNDLLVGHASVRKQDLHERTFYPRDQRPAAGCVISWDRDSADIGACVRALQFGPYPNPLGLAKLAVQGQFIIVSRIDVLETTSSAPAGTITDINRDSITVATTTGDLSLREMQTIGGRKLSIAEFVERFNLRAGYRFKNLDSETARRIGELHASVCSHEPFWVQRLATLQPYRLPASFHKLSRTTSTQYEFITVPLPEELKTLGIGGRKATDVAAILVAAFTIYLSRIEGLGRCQIGFRDVKANRILAGLEGLFAVDVPLCVDINFDRSFEEVFETIRKQVALVRKRKTFMWDTVARYPELGSLPELQPDQLFPVGVAWVEHLNDYQPTPGRELTLVIAEDEAEFRWLFDATVLEKESVARMMRQFSVLLQGIAADPNQRIAELPLLSGAERNQLLVEWNSTESENPIDKSIGQLFEAQVERTPDALAVEFKDQRLTYRQLNQRANQLAHHLRAVGVGPEVLVGICIERSLEMVVGLLGIVKSGGAYVPLDPAYPLERLSFILSNTRAPVLLTQERLAKGLPSNQAMVLRLDSDWAKIASESRHNPTRQTAPDHLAYVIHTSGSTGEPKGVMIQHQSLANYIEAASASYMLERTDRVLQFASISFDASSEEIFTSLICGAALVLRTDTMLDPSILLKKCHHWNLTVLGLPTAYWHELTERLDSEALTLPPSVRLVIIGGERAIPQRLAIWQQKVDPRVRLVNSYGPTEATVAATSCDLQGIVRPGVRMPKELPIGRPMRNVQVYLLDQFLQPVPIGVTGELHIGGQGLARGYLNRPDLTAAKFVANPFSDEPTARLYKTGDLARYAPDGNIEYLGRSDHQVKIRGFRVELGEVESVLAEHPSVAETVVIASEEVPGDKRLVAYLTTCQSSPPTVGELHRFLKKKLPAHMVPTAFVLLDALPLNPNGKLDRRALPGPDDQRPELGISLVRPRNALEVKLVQIWEQTLGRKPVGVRDNFMELGGHSLLAVKLMHEIEQVIGKTLPVTAIFQAPTIEQLAGALQTDDPTRHWAAVEPLQSQGLRPPFFFVAGKTHFGERLGPDQPVYRVVYQDLEREQPLVRVEDMAAHSIKSVRSIQPDGPYFLGGHGLGGMVAFEMAQQLLGQGEAVALLALCECWTQDSRPLMPGTSSAYRLWQRTVYSIQRARYMGAVRELKKLLQGLKKKTQRTLWQRQTGPRKRSLQGHRAAAQQALREYVPQVYPGRITVVRSSERVPWRLDDRLNGWGQLASEGVEVHEIPGNHTSIYREPNVELLVSTLKKILHHANVRTENEWTAFIDFDESVELMTPGYENALQT